MMGNLKVLVCDDSAFMRKLISAILSEHPDIDVAGIARNGADALDKARSLKPDVITMDVEMPEMNGMEALKRLKAETDAQIVMLSSRTKDGSGEAEAARRYGAHSVIGKPSGSISLDLDTIGSDIVRAVLSAGRAGKGETRPDVQPEESCELKTEPASEPKKEPVQPPQADWSSGTKRILICIGTSTGGPRALQEVLTSMPAGLEAPIVVVQHMPPGFTKSLASRLDSLCEISVKEAEAGDVLENATAYIAPGGKHMTFRENGSQTVIQTDDSPPLNGHRPSVDIMFESVGQLDGFRKIAVIMTGMGSDGAQGLIQIKKKSDGQSRAIAQSESSSIVYGMPKAAIRTKLVDKVVDLQDIAKTILKYMP